MGHEGITAQELLDILDAPPNPEVHTVLATLRELNNEYRLPADIQAKYVLVILASGSVDAAHRALQYYAFFTKEEQDTLIDLKYGRTPRKK